MKHALSKFVKWYCESAAKVYDHEGVRRYWI